MSPMGPKVIPTTQSKIGAVIEVALSAQCALLQERLQLLIKSCEEVFNRIFFMDLSPNICNRNA